MKNKTLLYSSFLLILLTLLVRWWVEEQFARVDINEQFIIKAIKNEVEEQEFAMIPILDSLSLHGQINSTYNKQTPYPFFIYEQGGLSYWSDFKFVPSYEELISANRYHYIDKPYGKFIVRKWVVKYKKQSFDVFSLITLFRKYPINNNYIQSGFNPKFGPSDGLIIGPVNKNTKGQTLDINGNLICSVKVLDGYKPSIVQPIIYIDFLLLILQILLFYALFKWVLQYFRKFELVALLLGWAYFKTVLPQLEGTTTFAQINLFDPQYYAVSWFEQSFADLLINTIFVLLVSVRLGEWIKNKKFLKRLLETQSLGYIFNVLAYFFTFLILNYQFFQLRSIYDNSQVSIDVSQSLQFGWTRVITYLIVILVSVSTFLLYQTALRLIIRFSTNLKSTIIQLLIGLLLFLLFSFFANMPFGNLALVNIGLIGVLWYFDVTRSLNFATYKRFLYIVLFFGLLAGINAFFVNKFETQLITAQTKNIVEKKLAKSDPFAEFLLSTALTDLSLDKFIIARLSSPFLSKKAVISKIKQVFLNSYLNKYEQQIYLFDAKGIPLNTHETNLSVFEQMTNLDSEVSKTEYPSVYRVVDDLHNFSKHYKGYASVKRNNTIIGYVLLELVEKQFSGAGVYPSLLVDNRFKSTLSSETSLAFYINGEMTNSIGSVEFPKSISADFKNVWQELDILYVLKNDAERAVVAGTLLNNRNILLSNFSFLWLITLFPILLVGFIYPYLKNGEFKSLSYTERIIWYLNLAFIIPLIMVTAVTFRLLSSSFENESNFSKTSLVERLANQLSGSLSKFNSSNDEFDNLVERIEILSDNTELDINLFGLNGSLIVSSQPGVFSKKVLAPYINQHALNVIKENGKNHLVLQESIDQLTYRNSYVVVKSEEAGQMLGIISVPFFNTNVSLNASKREAFNTILNVFVIVLFATMLVTYFSGKWLTKPLAIIREKLKSTSFSEQTEPIQIEWSDELGTLIKAYNQMLGSLEESKQSLKKSEKEKAWREAAQQVAHEIKNPLTPMKLTLQRVLHKLKSNQTTTEKLEAPLQSLLAQVETLNSIASSFSEFAKMPTPVVKRSEVNTIIRKSAELFKSELNLKLKLQLTTKPVYSMVDPKLLARMFTNLILNAVQSIKDNQEMVEVEIITDIKQILTISFKDNGNGIDPTIYDKVFIPKFTTKENGSGIGLALTKYGIENMQGKIRFTSEYGKGTTFIIELPIID